MARPWLVWYDVAPGIVTGSVPFSSDGAPNPGYKGRLQLVHSRAEEEEPLLPVSEIRPRDVVMRTERIERGETVHHVVKLEHKPSKLTVEGQGATYEEARKEADAKLVDALQLSHEEEAAFS